MYIYILCNLRVSFYKQICFVSVKLQTTIRVFYYNNCNNNSFLVSSLMFSLSFLFAFVGFLLLLFVCLRLKYFGLRVCLSVCVCLCLYEL